MNNYINNISGLRLFWKYIFEKKEKPLKPQPDEIEAEQMQGFIKEQNEEQRRLATWKLDQELKHLISGHLS